LTPSIFPLQAVKEFQTTNCKEYLAKHDSFSTKVKGDGCGEIQLVERGQTGSEIPNLLILRSVRLNWKRH